MSLFSPYVLIGIVIAVLGAYGGGRLQQYARDQASFQKKIDAMVLEAQEAKAAEEKRRQQAALQAEAAQAVKEKDRDRQMAVAAARIKNLSAALAATRVTDIAWVLNDAIAGNAAGTTAAAAKPSQSPATVAAPTDVTTVGLWANWSVAVIGLYQACVDQTVGLQGFYNNLRAAK